LFGLWRDDQAVAFDAAQPAPSIDLQVWRVDLPADAAGARDLLVRSQARLMNAAAVAESAAALPTEPVEFAVFAADESPPWWWRDASRAVTNLAGLLSRACSPTALIETSRGDEVVGRSLVGLRGDTRTAWRTGHDYSDALLHEATVALALSTRAELLRTIALVTRSAAAIAARLALPGGPLLALPPAWRLLQDALNIPPMNDTDEGKLDVGLCRP
jgi:hypothetical protein